MPVKKKISEKAKLATKIQENIVIESANVSSLRDKLRQPKILIGLIIVILIAVAFLTKGLFVAAIVNGKPITRLEIIRELEKQGGKQALSSLVNQTLILQEAKKKNVEVAQTEIDASIKQIEDSLKSQGQSLDAALAMQGMTRQDLILQMKLRNLVEKLLADKIKITDKEITDYIEQNKDSLPTNLTDAEMKKSVEEQLRQQKLSAESTTWLEELSKNAKVNYFVNY